MGAHALVGLRLEASREGRKLFPTLGAQNTDQLLKRDELHVLKVHQLYTLFLIPTSYPCIDVEACYC